MIGAFDWEYITLLGFDRLQALLVSVDFGPLVLSASAFACIVGLGLCMFIAIGQSILLPLAPAYVLEAATSSF